jgi:hypothetical protein
MGKVVVLLLLAFVVTLGVVVGNRMSAEAMAVVVGVVCGVAAGIPVSVLLMLALNRRHRPVEEPVDNRLGGRYAAYSPYPPVVVIQGGAPAANSAVPPYYPMPTTVSAPVPRQFHLIGDGDD